MADLSSLLERVNLSALDAIYQNPLSETHCFTSWPLSLIQINKIDCDTSTRTFINDFCSTLEYPFESKEFTASNLIEVIAQKWFAQNWTPKFENLLCSERSRQLIREFKKQTSHLASSNIFETYLIFAHSSVLQAESDNKQLI